MKMNNIFRKTFIGIVAGLTHVVILGTANATPIGIDAFSGSETVTTFNNLGLPFLNTGSLSLDGNTYTTDDMVPVVSLSSPATGRSDRCVKR